MADTINITIELERGETIKLELYLDVAPKSVDNFVKLIQECFFDGLIFHRNIPGFMIQGGGFDKNMNQKPAPRTVQGEFKMNGHINNLHHEPGVISMARTNVPDSASSQFFICVGDCGFLDGQYAAFGKCRDKASLDTAIALSKVPTSSVGRYDDVPVEPVVIKTIRLD